MHSNILILKRLFIKVNTIDLIYYDISLNSMNTKCHKINVIVLIILKYSI